jgi:hypothetical protein
MGSNPKSPEDVQKKAMYIAQTQLSQLLRGHAELRLTPRQFDSFIWHLRSAYMQGRIDALGDLL